jgi:hypothetical protein
VLAAPLPALASQSIVCSLYRLVDERGTPLGYTELTELKRPDGSSSFLARERMEFWGPVLDRFVVLSFDPQGHFDSGHWVGTSEYSAHFTYTFRFDGRVIRGDWQDSVRGSGWSEVPHRKENPLLGFWGPLESLLLRRFDPTGPERQTFDAADVEDSHHRQLTVTVERAGTEEIEVPAGRFRTTFYRSERFGTTHHWVDARGTLIRWSSEKGQYRWELERYPSPEPLPRQSRPVARGVYEVTAEGAGPRGTVEWSLERMAGDDLRLLASETLDQRTSRFEGLLDPAGNWKASTETARWTSGEGDGPPEIHHLETFFYRERIHVLRFRDRAYPLLQSAPVSGPLFHPVNYPIAAFFWLRGVPRTPGADHRLAELAHIANRYRGGGLEVQPAKVRYGAGHHFLLSYPGGWRDSTVEIWTDDRLIPVRVRQDAGEGVVEYKLVRFELMDESALPR